MSVDISVSITEDVVDIIATPTVNIVNVTNSASIDPGLYDLSEFTNTSPNPFVRASGLSSYVPTTRTLTINGVTQDLSANRTFTISTGITIGSTAIASGVVGRVLFEGAGNVVQESANLTWDDTNSRLALNGTLGKLMFPSPEISFGSRFNGIHFTDSTYATSYGYLSLSSGFGEFRMFAASSYFPTFYSNGSERMRIFTTGNIGVNTTTDAGFRLDVNGTARVQGALTLANGLLRIDNAASGSNALLSFLSTSPYIYSNAFSINVGATSNGGGAANLNGVLQIWNQLNLNNLLILSDGNTTAGERLRVTKGGNVLINTTTDAGFRLDVNGSIRNTGTSGIHTYAIRQFSGGEPLYFINQALTSGPQFSFRNGGTINNATQSVIEITNWSVNTLTGTGQFNAIDLKQSVSTSSSSAIIRGIYYNPTTAISGGAQHFAFHSTSGNIRFENLPTSAAGLPAGTLYNNLGVLMIA